MTSTETLTPALSRLIGDAEAAGFPVAHDPYGFRIAYLYVATREDGTFGFAYWVQTYRTLRTIKDVRRALRIDR